MVCVVHGVAKSWTRLSNFRFHFHFRGSVLATGAKSKYCSVITQVGRADISDPVLGKRTCCTDSIGGSRP